MRRQRGLKESKNKEKPFRWWIIINGIPHGPIYFTREICITTSIATLKLPVMGETWLIWIKRTSKVPGNSSIRLCAIELQLFLNQAPEKKHFLVMSIVNVCDSWNRFSFTTHLPCLLSIIYSDDFDIDFVFIMRKCFAKIVVIKNSLIKTSAMSAKVSLSKSVHVTLTHPIMFLQS